MQRHRLTAAELRKLLIDDSLERKRWMDQLVQLIRADERQKVITVMARARDTDREV